MISLAEARSHYPPGECPSDRELKRILAAMYTIANREWDAMVEEQHSLSRKGGTDE